MQLNKAGSAIIELIISIVIFATIVLVVGNFKVYLATHEVSIIKQSIFYTSIDNVVADLYSLDDWGLLEENFTIDTEIGELQVIIENKGVTNNKTNQLEIKFNLVDLEKIEILERSVYYNE